MPEWLSSNPGSAIIAAIAVIGAIFGIGRWVGATNASIKHLDEFAKEIRDTVNSLLERIPPQSTAGSSPRRLTDFGEKIAAALKAQEWASGVARNLLPEIQEMQPFQVEEFCREQVNDLGDPMENKVSACAYEFGTSRDNVRAVLQVVLRDELLRLQDAS